jgi:hypothetical protein
MTEGKEKNKTIGQNANGDEQNTVDKTTDILRLASTIRQNIAAFSEAKAFVGLQFSSVNLGVHPFSDFQCAQFEIWFFGSDFQMQDEEVGRFD